MRLENLHILNYRTLEDVRVSFNGFYTAISGQNNAGKTTLIKAIRNTFRDSSRNYHFWRVHDSVNYRDDKTQWVKGSADIAFDYCISVSRSDDPGLFQFIEKFNEDPLEGDSAKLRVQVAYKSTEELDCTAWVNDKELSKYASKEILQKLNSSNLAFTHDSANANSWAYGARGQQVHEMLFSPDELKQLDSEMAKVQKKMKIISKAHKTELAQILGHLQESYEVDFAIPEGIFTGFIPFSVNLRDKSVDIPLDDWGSGTKNRTQILMSILQANRIRCKVDENKITPFVIIEEPESFLHPSAQAEFGRVLVDLANELKIQTIVTTHSPYMLCQNSIESNVLLVRRQTRGRPRNTDVVEVEGENWMRPFGEILGLDNAEFSAWKDVLFSGKDCVLLVEGALGKV